MKQSIKEINLSNIPKRKTKLYNTKTILDEKEELPTIVEEANEDNNATIEENNV